MRVVVQGLTSEAGVGMAGEANVNKSFGKVVGDVLYKPRKERGLWQVATSGRLVLVFSVEAQIQSALSGVEDDDFLCFLDTHFELTRFKADRKKITALFAKWLELEGREADQAVYLEALAKDFNMSLPYLSYLCRSSPSSVRRTMMTMFPTVPSDDQSRYLAMLCFPKLHDFYTCYHSMESLLIFNPQNATGPPANAEALSDELWEDLMVTMYYSEARPQDKIKVLRSISHLIFITCMHMRQMVGYFKDPVAEDPDKDPSEREDPFLAREEAFVTFYLRIIDMHNSKQFLVRFEKQEELSRLRTRLGYCAAFPFIQPENTKFVLNLKYHDQRLCVSMIVDLALREKYGNIRDYSLTNEDGTTDPMTMGVPRSWADLAKLPSSGIFRCRYVCSPEDRQVEFRKKLAQTYGYMAGNFSPSDVSWWTGLKEAGDDVLDLLEFFISRYNHVDEAFRDIDGGVKEGENAGNTTSNGELTLREFEAGLKDIGCFKFKGPNEKERIGGVFRYLDPGGEGNVSLQEWQILDQLWKEHLGFSKI
ncbi:Vti1b [Symbiodinium sp. CCMP2456]|nr:Vti1b [Symbiodinium sp. CCMP2456]